MTGVQTCALPICQVSESDSVIMAAAVVSPSGELSVFMLNLTDDPKDITLDIENYSGKSLQVYQASKELVNVPGFSLEPGLSINSSKKTVVTLPARSITTVSGYKLNSEDVGIF